jgi:hypothetical protein
MFGPWGNLQNYVVIAVFLINACYLTILGVSLEVAFFNTAWSAGYSQLQAIFWACFLISGALVLVSLVVVLPRALG